MSNKSSERRALVEQALKAQRAEERRRSIILAVVVGVILVAIVVAVVIGTQNADTQKTAKHDQILPAPVSGPQTTQPAAEKVANDTGIDGVVAYNTAGYPGAGTPDAATLGHTHVPGTVKYSVIPPVGGDHNGTWMNAGVYVSPVPTERAVHLLEHGAVWITYNPSLPVDQVKKLQDFVGRQKMFDEQGGNANRYIVMSPWATDTLPAPIVISSWGFQLAVNSPDDPRLQKFVDTFRHSTKYTPETSGGQFPNVDGVPQQTGGEPAMYGSKNLNPSGSAGQ